MGAAKKQGQEMRLASFHEAAEQTYGPAPPPVYNWGASDFQPMAFDKVTDYLEVAKRLQPAAMELVGDVIIKAGFVKEDDRAALVERMQAQPERTRVNITDDLSFSWRIKTVERSTGKLTDSSVNQDPANIGDYLGFKLIPTTVAGIVRLRQAAIETSMTSRKCEFSIPSAEGYRSHKSHNLVEANGESQKIEILISHANMEQVDALTHRLKESELSLNGAARAAAEAGFLPDKTRNRLGTQMAGASSDIRAIRTAINNAVAYQTGIDDLALPEHQRGEPDLSALKLGRNATRRVLAHMREGYTEQLESVLGLMVQSGNWRFTHAANLAGTKLPAASIA